MIAPIILAAQVETGDQVHVRVTTARPRWVNDTAGLVACANAVANAVLPIVRAERPELFTARHRLIAVQAMTNGGSDETQWLFLAVFEQGAYRRASTPVPQPFVRPAPSPAPTPTSTRGYRKIDLE